MNGYVTLHYARTKENLSTGQVVYSVGDTIEILRDFKDETFKAMLILFAGHLIKYPDAGGAMHRTDHGNLPPYVLSTAETEKFRTDPADAIRQMTLPFTQVADMKEPELVNVRPPLDAGPAVRAQCFGELVYLRGKGRKVECATCGKWRDVGRYSELGDFSVPHDSYLCLDCRGQVAVQEELEGWWGVRVDDLLARKAARYFLPREWNEHGNWISLTQLQNKYDEYKKAKEAASK